MNSKENKRSSRRKKSQNGRNNSSCETYNVPNDQTWESLGGNQNSIELYQNFINNSYRNTQLNSNAETVINNQSRFGAVNQSANRVEDYNTNNWYAYPHNLNVSPENQFSQIANSNYQLQHQIVQNPPLVLPSQTVSLNPNSFYIRSPPGLTTERQHTGTTSADRRLQTDTWNSNINHRNIQSCPITKYNFSSELQNQSTLPTQLVLESSNNSDFDNNRLNKNFGYELPSFNQSWSKEFDVSYPNSTNVNRTNLSRLDTDYSYQLQKRAKLNCKAANKFDTNTTVSPTQTSLEDMLPFASETESSRAAYFCNKFDNYASLPLSNPYEFNSNVSSDINGCCVADCEFLSGLQERTSDFQWPRTEQNLNENSSETMDSNLVTLIDNYKNKSVNNDSNNSFFQWSFDTVNANDGIRSRNRSPPRPVVKLINIPLPKSEQSNTNRNATETNLPQIVTSGATNEEMENACSQNSKPKSYAAAVGSKPKSQENAMYSQKEGATSSTMQPNCSYLFDEACGFPGSDILTSVTEQYRQKGYQEFVTSCTARSVDKACSICFEVVLNKEIRERRFGILNNCNHCFCITCISKWRATHQFSNAVIKSCPICRVTSDFVCPSAYWVETPEEKKRLINFSKDSMAKKDCKYFKKGAGICRFGNECFYLHALPSGAKVDVGPPPPRRRRSENLYNVRVRLTVINITEIDEVSFDSSDSEFSDSDSEWEAWYNE